MAFMIFCVILFALDAMRSALARMRSSRGSACAVSKSSKNDAFNASASGLANVR